MDTIPLSSSEEELVQPLRTDKGGFQNPFAGYRTYPRFSNWVKYFKERIVNGSQADIPSTAVLNETLPVLTPDIDRLHNPPSEKIQYMWVGHASCLIQMGGVNILTDPIWSERCSFVQWIGPKRYRPPPLSINELPNIDVVVISHNHYDHLDYGTVLQLNERFGSKLKWYTPLGLRQWFLSAGCENVTELSWWQSESLNDQVDIICTPAQHSTLRNGCDQNRVLWSSWIVKAANKKFFFSGDTGYCDAFESIGNKYGPFDLAAISIGAYCPRYFMSSQHVDPQQAYRMHRELKSKFSFGIHWGTFPMGSTEVTKEVGDLLGNRIDLIAYCFATDNMENVHSVSSCKTTGVLYWKRTKTQALPKLRPKPKRFPKVERNEKEAETKGST